MPGGRPPAATDLANTDMEPDRSPRPAQDAPGAAAAGALVSPGAGLRELLGGLGAGLRRFLRLLAGAARDLAPVVGVVAFFQLAVFRQPFPDLAAVAAGLALVVVGLALFVHGLEISLFPIGEDMANALASRGSVLLLTVFAFGLGFGTTVAEPALIAVAGEAGRVAAGAGLIEDSPAVMESWSETLRYVVAFSVGTALVVGVFRILRGWPIHVLIIGGYLAVVALTAVAPPEMVGIAYDSGGVTTSTITVPLVTALGVGLAHVIRGRNPLLDGFGMIALASLFPMLFVLAYGILV